METNHLYCTRTGRTTSEKTMEDGNIINAKDEKITTASLANLHSDRSCKLTTNGHDFTGEPPSPSDKSLELRRPSADTLNDDRVRKRINPVRIHLGKRPFVDNSVPLTVNSVNKKRKLVHKPSDTCTPKVVPRVPKLIPKRLDHNQFHNVASHNDRSVDNEQDKPVPRLVPKSQLFQFKKNKTEKSPQLKEYAQSLGLQPMVKFKCRKCCAMTFKTLAMLKEHQLICRAQAKEPALSPEAAPTTESNTSGPSRVTRKVYLCSACGTYYENWNLFLHMREVHSRHICLFCLGMFSKAEKLSLHLTNKHNVQEFNYDSKEDFCKVHNGSFYLMCCVCDEICSEKDDFFNHDCNNVKPKPVPVLISKNSIKSSNAKLVKNINETASNGPSVLTKEFSRPVEQKDVNEKRPDTILPPQRIETKSNICDTSIASANSDASISSESSASISNNTSQTSSTNEVKYSNIDKAPLSPINRISRDKDSSTSVLNGKELDLLHDNDAMDTSNPQVAPPCVTSLKQKEHSPQPMEKEKECGIKLKLSLNNVNSPVIINSTVDPTVGQQYAHKPPTRNRRPPKRYEKDKPPDPLPPAKPLYSTPPSKPPSIKMTICDKADSPFVKTTFIENDKETIVKTLMNNNIEPITKLTETKPENTIKSTIYDNKLEEVNTLNRVPKLTVRVPKEFLDKDSSSDYSSDSDTGEKLPAANKGLSIDESIPQNKEEPTDAVDSAIYEAPKEDVTEIKNEPEPANEEKVQVKEDIPPNPELKTEPPDQTSEDINVEDPEITDNIPVIELTLDRPIDKYPMKDLLKVFLTSTVFNCIYCNHVRKIAVNCEQLALHMVAEHRFSATVDSITAEELMPETIAAKVKAAAEEVSSIFINLDSYDSIDKCDTVHPNLIFECFQCYFKTFIHKDLYLHNRKMHQKTILLCVMCKNNFYSYSELLCHLCPGRYDLEYEIKYRCCYCNVDNISSSFRLMVHLRKVHHTCDVCLEFCQSQARLSNHVWKHKLHHLCYRCGIAYRNKLDITNHLFWKHGTESVLCKRCLQKKWPHVYHFCTPPAVFVCDECSLQFTRAVSLKVHKRFHSEEYPHACTEEGCIEKFVSKKLLSKHLDEHRKKLVTENLDEEKTPDKTESSGENPKEPIPIIDLVDDKTKEEAESESKAETGTEQLSKKGKKKKIKDKDALLLDVNLPVLNLSESDSSDESDSGVSQIKEENPQDKPKIEADEFKPEVDEKPPAIMDVEVPLVNTEEKVEPTEEDKPSEEKVLEIWDNFKKYQATVEKQKEKTPPLVPIRKHVCESDHDYCVIPTDMNGDDDVFCTDKKKNKKSSKRHGGLSSSSSSSSDSDSSCSCGSNCSCSSSSGSSTSSSSDSDSSDESGNEKKKKKQKKSLSNRRVSNGSNVDVMGMAETPILIPEKSEPLIAETDLETEESETDEEFYDENPQKLANKMHTEKRNQLLLLASVAPSEGGSVSGEVSRCTTPIKEEQSKGIKEDKKEIKEEVETKVKTSSSKKKSKKKKRSRNYRKHGPIKMTIPKDVIAKSDAETPSLMPNKITISLQSNTVQIPEPTAPATILPSPNITNTPTQSAESKRASKRRRVPNKFYGYSSDEESPQTATALKPQQPPKLEWRKEDLPSPVTHKPKKEIPSTVLPQRMFNYKEPIRLTAPIPDPEPPRFLMNSESMESSDSDSSNEGALEIYQPSAQNPIPVPPPTYLNSGTSSLPYPFQRPAVRQAREGESVYCYCRCPYDEVSEMIACDAEGCPIEWFHFECVGIMVPPKGKWYCPECRKNQSFQGYR